MSEFLIWYLAVFFSGKKQPPTYFGFSRKLCFFFFSFFFFRKMGFSAGSGSGATFLLLLLGGCLETLPCGHFHLFSIPRSRFDWPPGEETCKTRSNLKTNFQNRIRFGAHTAFRGMEAKDRNGQFLLSTWTNKLQQHFIEWWRHLLCKILLLKLLKVAGK